MCGIAGIVGFDRERVEDRVTELLGIQHHRGPDASGFAHFGNVWLFHNRLSIIDLNDRSDMPFVSGCGKYAIIYNGEIYNYHQLAASLQQQGVQLRTSSDTEVILESFICFGAECVNRLNGMFAFAITEIETGKTWVFRDRIGIKPLYYYHVHGKTVFSSELKFIRRFLKGGLSVDMNAVGQFLHFGFIPEESSIYNEVRKLLPGSMMILEGGTLKTERYWDLHNVVSANIINHEAECEERLEKMLVTSVKRHLVSDVPVGIFLSGGVDSSLVAALAAEQVNGQLDTFSLGTDVQGFNETSFARNIANRLGTKHHECIFTSAEVKSMVQEGLNAHDEPFADSSSIPTFLLSRYAAARVKVCMTGEGSDELFGGYGSYKWARRLRNPFYRGLGNTMHFFMSESKNPRYFKALKMFDTLPDAFIPAHIFSQEQGFHSINEIAALLDFEPWFLQLQKRVSALERKRVLTPFESQSFFDLQNYLPDDLLVKVDRASMANSLEVRVPFLDHELVELSVNISPRLKIHGKTQKYILRKILYKKLPQNLFDRPKQGFSIPLHKWLETDLAFLIDDHLSENEIRKYGIIKRPDEVKTLVKRFRSGERHLYNRLWSLIILQRWLASNPV